MFGELVGIDARRIELPEGAVLFRQGDRADAIFQVERGRVLLRRLTLEGTPVAIHVARPGELFAEAALFSPTYQCDAIAESPARLLALPRAALRAALESEPEAAVGFARRLAELVHELRARLELRNIRSARERIWSYLLLHAAAETSAVAIDRPLKEIAAEIGLAPETLYRTLSRLQKEGVIRRRGRRILLESGSAS